LNDWYILPATEPSSELLEQVGGHPLVARLLTQRGFDTMEKARPFLDPEHYTPAPPTDLIGVAEAALHLYQAINQKQKILVWGDFDVDGQTSTSLLVAALHKLTGMARVRFHVPNRFSEGHGINPERLQLWLDDDLWRPDLLLTCDTGIAETTAVTLAKQAGLTVIITDHHDLTAEFQELDPTQDRPQDRLWGQHIDPAQADVPASVRYADAIVNPKFQPVDDPLRTLPGVGVAYKLIQHLYALCNRIGEDEEFLDLVALGIVADVAEQVHDARYLLQLGLAQLRQTQRHGLLALMDIARLEPAKVDAESIGFQIGPRMNALGRLEDATVSVELLTTRDAIRAGTLAAKMERLNQERRLLTSQITGAALEMIERNPDFLDFAGLVLAHPAWHAGIVGIVASRMVEEFNKPTVLILNPPGEAARGSARSIPGVDIGASIAGCGHLLIGHGGHPGAAGVSLLPENIDAFRRELDRQIKLNTSEDIPPGLVVDAELGLAELDMTLAEELKRLSPFGNANPTPQFMSRNVQVVADQRMGKEGNHRRLTVQSGESAKLTVVWFNGADVELPAGPLDLVYQLNINEFRGERTVQLHYIAHRPTQQQTHDIEQSTSDSEQLSLTAQIAVQDLRGQTVDSTTLPGPDQALWYAEGVLLEQQWEQEQVGFAPRTNIARNVADTLVLWSVPPSLQVLQWLVEAADPRLVYLCGRTTHDDRLDSLLKQVASMCKYALKRDRRLAINRMAARLGTTETVIRHSLRWLESRGLIQLQAWDVGDGLFIAEGNGTVVEEETALLQATLHEHLAEVRAYRRFFSRAKVGELIDRGMKVEG